jgi:hypothetical protein
VDPRPSLLRRVSPAVLTLLVLTAVAAATFSYLIARRLTADPPADASRGRVVATASVTPPATPDPDAPPCPAVTGKALAEAGFDGDLELVIYIKARQAGRDDAEVFVCRNRDGLLAYQGHVLTGPLDAADNGINTILLAEGIKGEVSDEGAEIVAVNAGATTTTEYHVSRETLRVVTIPGTTSVYEVVEVYPR